MRRTTDDAERGARESGELTPASRPLEDAIAVDAFEIPPHWPRIGGIDFGRNRPTAAALLAWDRDGDCLYVTQIRRVKEATPVIGGASLRPWGARIPWAWPADGPRDEEGSGAPLAERYRQQGLKLLAEHAGCEDGIAEMLERMRTGRWKVFRHLEGWFDDFRLRHGTDGRLVTLGHDLVGASRYAMTMRHHAETDSGSWSRPLRYGPTGIV